MDQAYKSLQDQAYIHLKTMIQNDELCEGVIYSETKMARELEISRTPFKAALTRLSQDKYIDIIPSKGFRVHVLSEEDIKSTYQTRAAIEIYCALMVTEARGTQDGQAAIRKMASSLDAMRSMVRDEDPEPFREQDRIFHTTLLAFCDNETFNELYEFSIYHQIVTASKGHRMSEQEKERTCEEHGQILEAIRTGSVEDCCGAVNRHMRSGMHSGLEYMEHH